MAPGVQGERWRRPRPRPYSRALSSWSLHESRGIARQRGSVGVVQPIVYGNRSKRDLSECVGRDIRLISKEYRLSVQNPESGHSRCRGSHSLGSAVSGTPMRSCGSRGIDRMGLCEPLPGAGCIGLSPDSAWTASGREYRKPHPLRAMPCSTAPLPNQFGFHRYYGDRLTTVFHSRPRPPQSIHEEPQSAVPTLMTVSSDVALYRIHTCDVVFH